MTLSTRNGGYRDASGGKEDAQRNVTCGYLRERSQGARGWINLVESEWQRTALPDAMGEGQHSLEKTWSQPLLK